MKQLLKLTLFAAFCAVTTAAFSQISFGVKAGLNLANVTIKGDGTEEFNPKILTTFQVGGLVDIGLTEAFAIETGLSLQGKGFRLQEDLLGETLKSTGSLYYLQVPAHFLYRGNGFFVGAGPFVGFGIAGKAKSSYGGQSESDDIVFGNGADDDVSPLDFGIGVQAGVKFGSIRIGAGYDLGLSDTTPKDAREDGYSTKNNVINVFVAYMFGK